MTNDRNKNVPLVEQFVGYTSPERTYRRWALAENLPRFALLFDRINNLRCSVRDHCAFMRHPVSGNCSHLEKTMRRGIGRKRERETVSETSSTPGDPNMNRNDARVEKFSVRESARAHHAQYLSSQHTYHCNELLVYPLAPTSLCIAKSRVALAHMKFENNDERERVPSRLRSNEIYVVREIDTEQSRKWHGVVSASKKTPLSLSLLPFASKIQIPFANSFREF